MHICIHTYLYRHTGMHTFMHIQHAYMRTCLHIRTQTAYMHIQHAYMRTCLHIRTQRHTHRCMRIISIIYIYICMYVCMYICIYVHTDSYVYVFAYAHVNSYATAYVHRHSRCCLNFDVRRCLPLSAFVSLFLCTVIPLSLSLSLSLSPGIPDWRAICP